MILTRVEMKEEATEKAVSDDSITRLCFGYVSNDYPAYIRGAMTVSFTKVKLSPS